MRNLTGGIPQRRVRFPAVVASPLLGRGGRDEHGLIGLDGQGTGLLRRDELEGLEEQLLAFVDDVFAAQGTVMLANQPSLAIAIVTNKQRWLYAFTVVNYAKLALPREIHAALAAIFGAKLD